MPVWQCVRKQEERDSITDPHGWGDRPVSSFTGSRDNLLQDVFKSGYERSSRQCGPVLSVPSSIFLRQRKKQSCSVRQARRQFLEGAWQAEKRHVWEDNKADFYFRALNRRMCIFYTCPGGEFSRADQNAWIWRVDVVGNVSSKPWRLQNCLSPHRGRGGECEYRWRRSWQSRGLGTGRGYGISSSIRDHTDW